MLKKEKPYEYTFNCINCLPLVYIACPNENRGVGVIMAPITEEQETKLNEDDCIIITDQYNRSFKVYAKNTYVYGTLDLSPNSDDICTIAKSNLFLYLYVNIIVFSNYDYYTHSVTSNVNGCKWYETDNINTYLPFLYGKIGKPERVVIFRIDCNKQIKRKRTSKENHKHYLSSKKYYTDYYRNKTIAKRKNKVSNLKFSIKRH